MRARAGVGGYSSPYVPYAYTPPQGLGGGNGAAGAYSYRHVDERGRGGGMGGGVGKQLFFDDDSSSKRRRRRPWTCVRIMCILAVIVALCVLGWLSPALRKAWRNQRTPDYPSEAFFPLSATSSQGNWGGGGGRRFGRFPSIAEPPTRTLSVIVPAYNEEERMREGLNEMLAYLARVQEEEEGEQKGAPFSWEVIVVDDGSKDATADIALREYVDKHGDDKVRLLRLQSNSGKGAAVRKGMMRARGAYLLMADADGATLFSDVRKLLDAARQAQSEDGMAVAIGSRAHLEEEGVSGGGGTAAVRRSPLRKVLMWGFHTLIGLLLGGTPVKDTQCGFKLFTRGSARRLFSTLHIERWAFDVELVYLASSLRMPVVEVPVSWHEVGGSKVDLASASVQMARDSFVIRLAYGLGWWKEEPPPVMDPADMVAFGGPPKEALEEALRPVEEAKGREEEEGQQQREEQPPPPPPQQQEEEEQKQAAPEDEQLAPPPPPTAQQEEQQQQQQQQQEAEQEAPRDEGAPPADVLQAVAEAAEAAARAEEAGGAPPAEEQQPQPEEQQPQQQQEQEQQQQQQEQEQQQLQQEQPQPQEQPQQQTEEQPAGGEVVAQ